MKIKKILKLIKLFDSFGSTENFKIEKKSRYQTIIGGLLNLLVYFIFFFTIGNSLKKYFKKEDVETSFSEIYSHNITLTSNDFIFSLLLLKSDLTTVNRTEFNKYFDMRVIYLDKDLNHKTFQMKECNFSEYRLDNQFPNFFCPDIPKGEEIVLESENSSLFFNIYFASNDVDKYIDFIGKINQSKDTSFVISVNNIFVNPEDYENPIGNTISNYFFYNNINIVRFSKFSLGKTEIETQMFDMFGLKETKKALGVTSGLSDFINKFAIVKGNLYYSAEFHATKSSRKFKRRYISFEKVVFDSIIYTYFAKIILNVLYNPYWDYKYKSFLFKKLTVKDKGANNKEYFNDDANLPRNILVDYDICKDFVEKNSLEKNIRLGIKKETIYQQNDKADKIGEISEIKENISKFPFNDLILMRSKNIIEEEEDVSKKIDNNVNKEEKSNREMFLKREYVSMGHQIKGNPTIAINTPNIKRAYDRLTSGKDKTKYNFWRYLLNRKKKGNGYNAIEEFSRIFMEKFNIFFYCEKMKDLDLIKKLLFNHDQMKLIDLLSKKHPFSLNTVNDKATSFKVEKILTMDEFKDLVSNMDYLDKLNRNILEEMFQFTENLKK